MDLKRGNEMKCKRCKGKGYFVGKASGENPCKRCKGKGEEPK